MGRKYTVRHATRRKLEGCAKLCDSINKHLSDVAPNYEGIDEDRFNAMLEIGSLVETVRTLLLALRKAI